MEITTTPRIHQLSSSVSHAYLAFRDCGVNATCQSNDGIHGRKLHVKKEEE
jgi:hypothetical protein